MSINAGFLTSVQTTALLNAFMAAPREGLIYVPDAMITDGPRSGDAVISSVPLSQDNACRFAESVNRLMGEAKKLEREHSLWSLPASMPLLGGDRGWTIENFPSVELTSFDNEADYEGPPGLPLQGPNGRRLRIDTRREGTEVGVGWRTRNATAMQTVFVDQASRVWTSTYEIDFIQESIEGLRNLLNRKKGPLIDVGLDLALMIFVAEQFETEWSENGLNISIDGSEPKLFHFGQKLQHRAKGDRGTMQVFSIVSTRSGLLPGRSKGEVSTFSIEGEAHADGDGYLNLTLSVGLSPQADRGDEMQWPFPLEDALFKLWRGARLWAHADSARQTPL
jgi:hypothetical protein